MAPGAGTTGEGHMERPQAGDSVAVLDLRGLGLYDIEDLHAGGAGQGYGGTIVLRDGSGSIEFIDVEALIDDACHVPVYLDGTVEGTEAADVINADYAGDPEGDRIDAQDAVLPGASADDDLVLAGGGADQVFAGQGDDEVYGGAGNDSLFGGLGNDTLIGGDGDDSLVAGGGDDLAFGGAGDDRILGLSGANTLYGGEGADSLTTGAPLLGGVTLPDQRAGVAFGGAGDDVLRGSAADDRLFGGDGDDVLAGRNGDDVLAGGAGDDTLTGGQGADVISGGADQDLIRGGTAGDVVDGGSAGKDHDTLDLTGSGVARITFTSEDREDGIVHFHDGGSLSFAEIETVVPCFTPGTTIATPRGETRIEDLKAGDRIITRDNGIQEVRWVGRKDISGRHLIGAPHLRPVLIKAGALGLGLPERDMVVSPNHRMLMAGDRTQLYFEEAEVLAAAKHLAGADGVHIIDVLRVSYFHFMCDRHEVVLSNGAWTESFQPGDQSLKGVGNAQRLEIIELFPELEFEVGRAAYVAARKTLKKHEAQLLKL